MLEGYYFGRFQPPCKHHLGVVENIRRAHPEIKLTVCVANSDKTGKTQENFLRGEESAQIFRLALADSDLEGITVATTRIDTTRPLAESLKAFFESFRISPRAVAFSGSAPTLEALAEVAQEFNLEIIKLDDDDVSGPRARRIREGLFNGTDHWDNLVTSSTYQYLNNPSIVQRIRTLPNGTKRPWAAN